MGSGNILFEQNGHIGLVTLNHPPANTWNLAMGQDFQEVVEQLEQDPQIRVVAVTGAGDKFFSAGYDVNDAPNATVTSPLVRQLFTRLHRLPKPTVAVVNGHAMGGGLELALCCHFRIMTSNPKTKVGLTELNLGLIPGWGGTQRLSAVLGRSKALQMIMFSQTLSPEQALECNLVDRLAAPEKLMEEAQEFAGQIAQRPPIAVSWLLKAMTAGEYEGLEAGYQAEAEGTNIVVKTKDSEEGFRAFLEKRKPVFTGE